jgi:RNA polymerase sigma-70 factor, ECF subfamily
MRAEFLTDEPPLEPVRRGVVGPDLDGFADVFERHYADVVRYATVMTGDRDDGEDVAAETFARAWRASVAGAHPEGPVLAWLFVIARNIATDRWRRLRRIASRQAATTARDSQTEVDTRLWLDALAKSLPLRQREVVALRYHVDLSDADIARLMGLSESGVRSLLSRAIATLRRHPEVWR